MEKQNIGEKITDRRDFFKKAGIITAGTVMSFNPLLNYIGNLFAETNKENSPATININELISDEKGIKREEIEINKEGWGYIKSGLIEDIIKHFYRHSETEREEERKENNYYQYEKTRINSFIRQWIEFLMKFKEKKEVLLFIDSSLSDDIFAC